MGKTGVISASGIALIYPTAHKCAFYWLACHAIISFGHSPDATHYAQARFLLVCLPCNDYAHPALAGLNPSLLQWEKVAAAG